MANEAVMARNALKVAGRFGLNKTGRVYTTEQMLARYQTEEAVIAAAGRTNTGYNIGGAAAIAAGIKSDYHLDTGDWCMIGRWRPNLQRQGNHASSCSPESSGRTQ